MKKYLASLVFLFSFFSCEKEAVLDAGIKDIIHDEMVLFSPTTTPIVLQDVYDSSEILMFGETHYVQEHQDFVVSQLASLSAAGYRVVFDELFHCFSWMVEDYLDGTIEELPEFILYFNETLIEGVKQFNSTVADSLQFSIAYMDVNHWSTNFLTSIGELEKLLGEQAIFTSIKNSTPDSESYRAHLQTLKHVLEADAVDYIDLWGEKWYARILDMVVVEVASAEYRVNRSDEWRESVMLENINRVIQNTEGEKYLVNTGFFHGQKQTHMGSAIDRIGKRLKDLYEKTYSIVFVGMRGERKQQFNDENNIAFDLPEEADSDDMIREVDQLAGNSMSFLSLSDSRFSTSDIKVSYSSGTVVSAPIGEQFDAIITYPAINTLQSMAIYDWQ